MKKGKERGMINREYNSLKRMLMFFMAVILCMTFCPFENAVMEAEAAESYKFTRSFISGDGDISSKFRLTIGEYNLTGLCRHGGPASSPSSRAVITKLKRTDDRFYLAYYYGRIRGWTSGAEGCDLARAFHYATYGTAYHQSVSKSKTMISKAKAYAQENGIPDNFVAYDCDPADGSQEFIAWYYAPGGYLKIVKKSSDKDTTRTGKYSFKDIQYKVYSSESTKSKCYGILTCNKSGVTDKIKLPADGFEARIYYVRETKTNEFFKISSKWYKVSVTPGSTKTLTVTDKPEYGSLLFNKVFTDDSDEDAVKKGFKFVLTNNNDSRLKYTSVSDDKGQVEFKDVLIGKYTLKEVISTSQYEKGYRSVTRSKTVTIGSGSNTLGTSSNSFINEKKTEKPGLIISKQTDDNGSLKGWEFTVKNTVTGEVRKDVTDDEGLIIIENLPAGTYEITEVMTDEQECRYYHPEPQRITILAGAKSYSVVSFENKGVSQSVKIKKVSEDRMIEGIEFTISGTKYSGTEYECDIEPISGTSDENGILNVGGLPPGEYVVEETGFEADKYINAYPLEGYENPARKFTVTGEGVVLNGKLMDSGEIEFENRPFKIRLEKTEMLADGTLTDNPVKGAEYELYYLNGTEEILTGVYTTDSDGVIEVYDVCPGNYRFYETSVPAGYIERSEEETLEFTLKSTGNGSITIKDFNRQKYGSVFIKKSDEKDNPVENAEFGLFFDEACKNAAMDKNGKMLVEKSDERGYIIFDNLEWNTYYLKEIKAPRGYEVSDEVRPILIGYDDISDAVTTDYEIHMKNDRMKGTVELRKVDESGDTIEGCAVYDLYRNDGVLIKEGLRTGIDNDGDGSPDGTGVIRVSGLEWGSYYFLEKEAPLSYSLSEEKVRFTVNAFSGGTVQRLKAVDRIQTTYVIATKKILASDIHYEHGVPSFTFNLKGTDAAGDEHEYNRVVTFPESYVDAHTAADGYVSISTTFSDIPAGIYDLTEDNVIRYEFREIEANSLINGSVNGESVRFDLLDGKTIGAATFINVKNEWNDYSDTGTRANIVKKQKLYTALTAEYTGKVLEGNMPVDDFNDYLEVNAVYDDGSEVKLEASAYSVADIDGNIFDRTPKVAGYYTLTVTHSESGIEYSAIVEIQVAPAEWCTVHFEVDGGSRLQDMKVWKYDTLSESTNDVSQYTTYRDYYKFSGWFTDENKVREFSTDKSEVISDITLYAKWVHKHLSDYSWAEIEEISLSGKAADILGECFDETKEDIRDGRLSSYEHTGSFSYQGKKVHAMITGFGTDTDAEGRMVGISFMTYEAAGKAPMNVLETNIGGWEGSELRAAMNSGINADITDAALKSSMKRVKRFSAAKSDDGSLSIVTTYDKLAVPSQMELAGVFGFESRFTAVPDIEYGVLKSLKGEGNMYPLFNGIVPDGSSNSEKALGRGYTYWTRSLSVDSSGFCTVLPNGAFSFTGS